MPAPCVLYYITDRTAFPGDESARRRRLLEKISEAARVGVDYIQLREKDLPTRELESLAREAVNLISERNTDNRERRTALLINSRTDVALAAGADGVHLRSDDLSPQDVQAIWKQRGANLPRARAEGAPARKPARRDPVIGVSCHSVDEVAQAAVNGATLAVFAPVFEKLGAQEKNADAAHLSGAPLLAGFARSGDFFARPGHPQLLLLRQACQRKIPVLALGGITLANARSCLEAGASGIAAIRLFQENDIAEVVRQLRNM